MDAQNPTRFVWGSGHKKRPAFRPVFLSLVGSVLFALSETAGGAESEEGEEKEKEGGWASGLAVGEFATSTAPCGARGGVKHEGLYVHDKAAERHRCPGNIVL